ncbi:formylglycine-generating enzyme family protein [Streptomyces sp. NPDC050658]|uniref:formylglycine-generating enzyme family protein n=1 Tax=unclassified Streptomyces TaxID=2593676 RepID=UPI00341C7CFE
MPEYFDCLAYDNNDLREFPPLSGGVPTRTLPDHKDPVALVAITEDDSAEFADRLTAGCLLGIQGDPRVGTVPSLTYIPGGDVKIGLPCADVQGIVNRWKHVGVREEYITKETPEHVVQVDDFLIGTHPVTNSQYRAFLSATNYAPRPASWLFGGYPWDRANHPVHSIRAADADAYVAWLRDFTGKPFRLPSEVEWEYAAKGKSGLAYPWGDEFDTRKANTFESGIHTTTPVGIYPGGHSPFGVWDMGGNVEEYVADEYSPYPGGTEVKDHLLEGLGAYRIARGGCFARHGDLARTRRRHGIIGSACGFRVATSEE